MTGALAGSFRDPAGCMFSRQGTLFRQVNRGYRESFERLGTSGLYSELVGRGLLISHEETDEPPAEPALSYKVIRPRAIPFVSYPYEWCFGQLQAAALATLAIQKAALDRGMSLKDASAYNVQFLEGKPIFIDTLSFEADVPGRPWIAYGQFCRHFLAPLLLMSHGHAGHGLLSRIHLDGVPLDLASSMLPLRTRFRFSTLVHVHLHAWLQGRAAAKPSAERLPGRHALRGLIDSLEGAVSGLSLRPGRSTWAGYYADTNYSPRAFAGKRELVARMLARAGTPRVIWDLGANTGAFSRLAAARGGLILAFDLDPLAVEANWREVVRNGEKSILPLVMDLANPSPGTGWENAERMSLAERGPADAVLALALIHHLAIGNNLPFARIAGFLAGLGRFLLLEFVPAGDSQVRRLLATRRDGAPGYTREAFEAAFLSRFDLVERADIGESDRSLYLFERKPGLP